MEIFQTFGNEAQDNVDVEINHTGENSSENEEYQLVFRQTMPKLYSKGELEVNVLDSTSDNYAILHILDNFRWSDGRFYFRMQWPGDDTVYEWSQTSNPVTETIKGYEPISIPYAGRGWGGLGVSKNALADGCVNSHWHQFFYAIGSFKLWKTGIPSYAKTDNDYNYPRQTTELYVKMPVHEEKTRAINATPSMQITDVSNTKDYGYVSLMSSVSTSWMDRLTNQKIPKALVNKFEQFSEQMEYHEQNFREALDNELQNVGFLEHHLKQFRELYSGDLSDTSNDEVEETRAMKAVGPYEKTRAIKANTDTQITDVSTTKACAKPTWEDDLREILPEKIVDTLVIYAEDNMYTENDFKSITDSELKDDIGFKAPHVAKFRALYNSKKIENTVFAPAAEAKKREIVNFSKNPALTCTGGIVITVQIHNWLYKHPKFAILKDPQLEIAGVKRIFDMMQKDNSSDLKYHFERENITTDQIIQVFEEVEQLVAEMSKEDQEKVHLCIFFGGHGYCENDILGNPLPGVAMTGVDGSGFNYYNTFEKTLRHIPTIIMADCCRVIIDPRKFGLEATRAVHNDYCFWVYSTKRGKKARDGLIFTKFVQNMLIETDQRSIDDGEANVDLVEVMDHVINVVGGESQWYRDTNQYELFLDGTRALKGLSAQSEDEDSKPKSDLWFGAGNEESEEKVEPEAGSEEEVEPEVEAESEEEVESPVRNWSPEECRDWIADIGGGYELIGEVFVSEGMDGDMMLNLDNGEWDDIIQPTGVSLPSIKRKKILKKVAVLEATYKDNHTSRFESERPIIDGANPEENNEDVVVQYRVKKDFTTAYGKKLTKNTILEQNKKGLFRVQNTTETFRMKLKEQLKAKNVRMF